MGKELPLAREEEEGQSVLLASSSSGEPITTSSSGDKRTQEPNPSKGSKGRKVEDTKTKSKSRRKVKGADARPKRQRRRRDNQDREQNRGDEGEDSRPRRTAQELGIVHPGSYCDASEIVPHYWLEVEVVDRGSLFQCKYCRNYTWLPTYHLDAIRLGSMMMSYGKNEGYCRYLNYHRAAKVMLAKMQDLRRLQREIADKREFARLTDKILSDKEYDRKEVTND